jgi:hypothetical protein
LGLALAAAGLLDMILVVTFGWSELFSPGVRNALWVALGMVWLGGLVFFPGAAASPSRGKDSFPEAIDHYLQGNWFQAERVLSARLRQDAGDLDARLMLATLLRRTGRWEEAQREVDVLERCEGAWKWGPEIHRERQLLTEARNAGQAALGPSGTEQPQIPAESRQSNASAAA